MNIFDIKETKIRNKITFKVNKIFRLCFYCIIISFNFQYVF